MSTVVPTEFKEYLDAMLPQASDTFIDGLQYERKTSVRLNRLKADPQLIRDQLETAGYKISQLDFHGEAWRIEEEPNPVSKTLEHFLGLIYIQSVASMMPPLVLDPKPHEFILDISAAPGSKTTQLAQLMCNGGSLVANDWDGKRIKTLSHNLDRMGVINAAMVHMPGERIGTILPETFDRVLVDAPCSAIGVIHKAPEALANLRFVQKFAFLQQQLLISAIKAVKTGGEIVYSTCTITPEENEKLIDDILKRYPVELLDVSIPSSIVKIPGLHKFSEWTGNPDLAKTVRLLPSENNPEGFFIARLRKTSSMEVRPAQNDFPNRKNSYSLVDTSDKTIAQMAAYFEDRFGIPAVHWDKHLFHVKEDEILVTSAEWAGRVDVLNRIYTHRVGTRIARTRKAGEWKLSTNAAQIFSDHVFKNLITLTDKADVETYLDGGMIRKPFGIEKGGVVVAGKGYVLGCGVIHQGALKSQMPKSRKVLSVDL